MNRTYAYFAFALVTALASTASADPIDRGAYDRRPAVRPAFERPSTPRFERPTVERPRATPEAPSRVIPERVRPALAAGGQGAAAGRSTSEARPLPASRWGDLALLKSKIEAFIKDIKEKNDSGGR